MVAETYKYFIFSLANKNISIGYVIKAKLKFKLKKAAKFILS